ncbi:MAG: WD40 repeat domain-containing protein [Planctomycetes bacterium]|nr:WD40 repeat domain-containing protein [Planctomycetota bacterium]
MRTATVVIGCLLSFGTSTAGESPPTLPLPAGGFRTLRTIETDADFAQALAFSPDGGTLAVADGTAVRFWDPRTGKERAEPWKLSGTVKFLAFVDAATLAVIAAPRTSVSVRQYPQGKELARLDADKDETFSCLATTKGTIAVGSEGAAPAVRLFTGPNWRRAWRAELPAKSAPLAPAFGPNKKDVLATTWGKGVLTLAAADGRQVPGGAFDAINASHVTRVCASPDGLHVASGPVDPGAAGAVQSLGAGVVVFDVRSKSTRFFRWELDRDSAGLPLGCAFTPDGKTLVVPCRGQTVRLYELETGELRVLGHVPCNPYCFALSPDGRLFAFAGSNSYVAVVDWRGTAPRKDPPDAAALNRLWAALAGDSTTGFSAVVELGAAPAQAAKFFDEKLKPVPVARPDVVKTLIADLGSDEFAAREAAEEQLAALGEAVEAELREAVQGDDPERRDRAQRLLRTLNRRARVERVRALRAVEVLEYADTPAGRVVLAKLAAGAPSARLTQDAKAALDRLRASDPNP